MTHICILRTLCVGVVTLDVSFYVSTQRMLHKFSESTV